MPHAKSTLRLRTFRPLLALFALGAMEATFFACSSDDESAPAASADAGNDATTHADASSKGDAGAAGDSSVASDAAKEDAASDAGQDAADAALQTLQFWSPCVKPDGGPGKEADIAPAPGEDDFLLGVRLTPPSYPFTVYKIRYAVATQGSGCRPDLAHRVEVSVDSATAPSNTPTLAATIMVQGAAADAGAYDAGPDDSGAPTRVWLEQTLPTPITLTTGQNLFVSIQLAGIPGTQTLCVGFCFENTIADRNYWSQAASVPYDWTTLDGIGFPINAEVEALGLPQ
jgi:hypothetical protein